MSVSHVDVINQMEPGDGQNLLSGLALPEQYPLERFIFDVLDAYSRAQAIATRDGASDQEFVRSSTGGLISQDENGRYVFDKTFTVTAKVTAQIGGVSASSIPNPPTV